VQPVPKAVRIAVIFMKNTNLSAARVARPVVRAATTPLRPNFAYKNIDFCFVVGRALQICRQKDSASVRSRLQPNTDG